MKRKLANALRHLASAIDGQETVSVWLHRLNVMSTNRYIGEAERYICALEKALGPRAIAIREKHPGRFDTQPLVERGAWN